LGRLHLFELEDQSWFPSLIRDAGSSYLAFVARVAGHAEAFAPKLAEALNRSGEDRIVDLCSGGSGPLPGILEVFDSTGDPDRPGIQTSMPSSMARRLQFSRLWLDIRSPLSACYSFRSSRC
jgi:hypothetical protein